MDNSKDNPQASPEKIEVIERFSDETREHLLREGFEVYTLTGRSIIELEKSGRNITRIVPLIDQSPLARRLDGVDSLPSRKTEVAINTRDPYLKGSDNKSLADQKEMVEEFDGELKKKVKGVRAIMGGVSDYADLVFIHRDNTGENLFKRGFTRTETFYDESNVARIGDHRGSRGSLQIAAWSPDTGQQFLYVAPLIVPDNMQLDNNFISQK